DNVVGIGTLLKAKCHPARCAELEHERILLTLISAEERSTRAASNFDIDTDCHRSSPHVICGGSHAALLQRCTGSVELNRENVGAAHCGVGKIGVGVRHRT